MHYADRSGLDFAHFYVQNIRSQRASNIFFITEATLTFILILIEHKKNRILSHKIVEKEKNDF
jgi:hypothetical protein